jgi:hypothetical protein
MTAEPISVGDTVIVRWTTPGGKRRKARGKVLALSEKRGVKFNYLHVSSGRGGFNMQSRDAWRPLDCCQKVQSKPEELTPSQAIGAVVMAMAGRPGELLPPDKTAGKSKEGKREEVRRP